MANGRSAVRVELCQEISMDRIKNIVVGIDFSPPSKTALAEAMRIARWHGAVIHAVHVIESVYIADVAEAYGCSESDFRESVVDSARRQAGEFVSAAHKLNVLVAQSRVSQIEARLDIRVGSPLAELLRCIGETSADLIVLGSSGWSDPKRGPGVLATQCLRQAPTRVLLVHELSPGAFKRVLCCVDFSDTSRLAVEQAAGIARQERADLLIVYAFTPPWEIMHYAASMPEASPGFQEEYRRQLHSRLEQFVGQLDSVTTGLKVESHVTESADSKSGLVDFVRSSGADLVVLGTQGQSLVPAGGITMGRTAERLVRESPCSILAVKPKGFMSGAG
jgi:universal stress protein E